MEYWRDYLPANWIDCSLSGMLQRDWSTAPVNMITSSHCYNDFTGCLFLNVWSSNCASWRIVVSMVLVRTTSRVTLWAYPTCVQDKNYAQPSTAALVVPVTRHSTLGDRAFPVIAAKFWNALPGDITSATSLLTFRHKLKTFLFRRSYGAWLFWILCVFVLAFYFLVFIFFWCFYVFLSCCNVFLKCSLHLYHANQFVVMIMMMNCVISCILICCTNVLIHSFVCPLWVPNSKEKQISIEKPKFMSMFSWRRMKLMCQLWSSHFIYLFSVHDTQFPRAEIWNYRNYIWNGHVTVWTWNMSARQAALKHWTVTNKRRNWNAVSTGVCHQFTY